MLIHGMQEIACIVVKKDQEDLQNKWVLNGS
jgi:hypothetical protein